MYLNHPLFYVFILHLVFNVTANLPAPYFPIDDIAVNCGSIGNSSALDGREWTGDIGTKLGLSRKQAGSSMTTKAVHTSLSGDPVPYLTARASRSPFFYTFKLHPGPKFVRLHFNPASYIGFETATDLFTVRAGPYTLLHEFSPSLAARAASVISFSREFCVSIDERREMTVTIAPSRANGNAYGFVNGIEIVSMPSGLYHTPEGKPGADVIGPHHRYKFYIDNTTALETVHRLNIGGSPVSPIEDTGMFRRWSKDSDYLSEKNKNFQVYHATNMIKYTNIPTFSAPLKVYQTSRSSNSKKSTRFTWKLPVDLGFRYLIRLHFCQHEPTTRSKIDHGEFGILVNDHIAERNAEVTKWSGGYGIAVYKDYVTMMRGNKMDGKSDLSVAIVSNTGLIEGKLNGLEVFKISNPDDSLAGSNPAFPSHSSSIWMPKLPAFGSINATATKSIMIITGLNIIVYIQRWFWEEKLGKKNVSLPSSDEPCRRPAVDPGLEEDQRSLAIWVHQSIKDGKLDQIIDPRLRNKISTHCLKIFTELAEKCLENRPKRRPTMANIISVLEFALEQQESSDWFIPEDPVFSSSPRSGEQYIISPKSPLNASKKSSKPKRLKSWRWDLLWNGVKSSKNDSFISKPEMILVYEYMINGSLRDHLHGSQTADQLTWKQRLQICIDAALGLTFLQTVGVQPILHLNINPGNILLDENLVAKISDYGLSKVNPLHAVSDHLTTVLGNHFGYLDPEYIFANGTKPTEKSDIYSFGLVLLEVLCGRKLEDHNLQRDQVFLKSWVKSNIAKGTTIKTIDPSLKGKIAPECLKEFIKIADRCLADKKTERPSMSEVVKSLKFAAKQQEAAEAAKSYRVS
ncbi:hypothetical protein L6452_41454 [Arctium lappa]|uniref:Uncharacterized protein n=1 Tax=Arctium lappa TaxID=4217 RepID=A0ACB8XND8_ARCLA|nr:hypothetical protein L6452_41454 [Arctium lappa]